MSVASGATSGILQRPRALRALAALAGLGACACLAPLGSLPPDPSEEPRAPSLAPRATARSYAPSDQISVRLAALDGRARVTIEGAAGGPLELERTAHGIAAGGAQRSQHLVEPELGGGLRVDGRPYPGRFLVAPRPEGGLAVVNQVDLEAYVRGVVTSEIPVWSAPPGMLEAQSIAARTYALRTLLDRGGAEGGAFLWDTTYDQAYRGSEVLETLPAEVRTRVEHAVRDTRGIVLTYRGELLEALYHAACGGATANLTDVFGRKGQAPLQPVPCAECARANLERDGEPTWKWTATGEQLAALSQRLALGDRLTVLAPTRVDDYGRWLEVRLTGTADSRVVSMRDLRAQLGSTDLKSSRVLGTWPPAGESIGRGMLFEGVGRGHGVGLCQTGALALARDGATSRRILGHYYPGAVLLDWHSLPQARR